MVAKTRNILIVLGKQASVTAAQAQAAQAAAILQGLDAFSHLGSNAHRWDVSLALESEQPPGLPVTDKIGR